MAANDDESKERIQLSVAQIAASCLAAISAAVLCSFFGVAGTVIGTAIASLFATAGSAIYAHSLRRTRARLRRLHQAGAAAPPITEVIKTARQQGERWFRGLPWRLLAIGAGVVFIVSIGVVTIIELSAGETISALLGVSHSGAHETSLWSAVNTDHHHHKAKPKPSPTKSTATPTPSPSHTPTPTPTPTPTVTPTPTPSSVLSSILRPPSASATPS